MSANKEQVAVIWRHDKVALIIATWFIEQFSNDHYAARQLWPNFQLFMKHLNMVDIDDRTWMIPADIYTEITLGSSPENVILPRLPADHSVLSNVEITAS